MNLRRDYMGVVIPIVVITFAIILILLVLWSKFTVDRLERLKLKVDNMNNPRKNIMTPILKYESLSQ